MVEIIHDPTRGWLLLTPDGQIEIAKEDLKDIVILGLWDEAEDHHPYSVDAEFEVVEQWSLKGENDWYSDEDDRFDLHHPDDCDYRQIARLVKAKENTKQKEYAEIQSKQITNTTDPKEGVQVEKSGKEVKLYSDENQAVITSMFINGEEWVKKPQPTDSVTSDGTPLDANQFNSGDRVNHFLVNALKQLTADEIATLGKSLIARGTQPTESQDELWNEVDWLSDYYLNIEEAKKRFRIERI